MCTQVRKCRQKRNMWQVHTNFQGNQQNCEKSVLLTSGEISTCTPLIYAARGTKWEESEVYLQLWAYDLTGIRETQWNNSHKWMLPWMDTGFLGRIGQDGEERGFTLHMRKWQGCMDLCLDMCHEPAGVRKRCKVLWVFTADYLIRKSKQMKPSSIAGRSLIFTACEEERRRGESSSS